MRVRVQEFVKRTFDGDTLIPEKISEWSIREVTWRKSQVSDFSKDDAGSEKETSGLPVRDSGGVKKHFGGDTDWLAWTSTESGMRDMEQAREPWTYPKFGIDEPNCALRDREHEDYTFSQLKGGQFHKLGDL